MAVTVTIPAESTALTTTAAIKNVLGVSSIKFDAALDRLIAAATSAIEIYVGHVYAKQTYLETVNGAAHPLLMLTNTPIVSVTLVLCESEPVTDFKIHSAETGVLSRSAGWMQSAWVGWGAERGVIHGTGDLLYSVTYEAGYVTPGLPDADLPAHIEQACIETVVDWYRSGSRDDAVKSKKVGDLSITYKSSAAGDIGGDDVRLPVGARALLSRRAR